MAEETTKDKPEADQKKQDQKKSDGLIKMSKNGETIKVHPTCVKGHEFVGWRLAE
jgi:hypothetical protein